MHPAPYSVGAGGLSPGLKMPGPKVYHPSASGNEFLNEWSYTWSSLYAFMTCTETLLPLDMDSVLVWNISNILPVSLV